MERTKGTASILPAGAILIARLIVNKKGSFRHPSLSIAFDYDVPAVPYNPRGSDQPAE
jgi:hypothetical protein